MTNPMFNPQPNYSGVTIQIANPAVNVSPYGVQREGINPGCGAIIDRNSGISNCIYPVSQDKYGIPGQNGFYANGYNRQIESVQGRYAVPDDMQQYDAVQNRAIQGQQRQGNYINYPQGSYATYPMKEGYIEGSADKYNPNGASPVNGETDNLSKTGFSNAYPVQYYLNNYNYNGDGNEAALSSENGNIPNKFNPNKTGKFDNNMNPLSTRDNGQTQDNVIYEPKMNSYKMYAQTNEPKDINMNRSKNIIEDLDERENKLAEEKKNTKETKIVALTDEYIKSLENYLNNPNDEIRLMASKEILTRLDEDKDRYNDAALNALLNKMLQDPNKLVRIASLSAFASQLASGNDYTVQLLHNIQTNPNADKEDVLQAADILLKMSAGVEVKNIPNPSAKENNNPQNKV